jgi:Pectate lyase superfamily protein
MRMLIAALALLASIAGGESQTLPVNNGSACPSAGQLSRYQDFVNTANRPTGTTLNVWDGTQCVQWGALNESTHLLTITNANAKCDGATDDAAAINAAITAANTAGGGRVVLNAGTCIVGSPVQLLSNVALVGTGIGSTILKLKNGVNVDVVDGAANLFGGSPAASSTISFAQLSDMTIDGNSANNTTGTCVGVVGYRNSFINLKITNCAEYGLRTELINDPAGPMESFYSNILIDTTGKHGWWNHGPHDSNVDGFIVVDAGQATNNTWDAIFGDTNSSLRVTNMHTWHRGSSSNRTRYGFNSPGGNNVTTSNFEGSWTANTIHQGSSDTFIGNSWYSPWNGTNIIIKQAFNFLSGIMLGNCCSRPASVGIVLGQGGDNAGFNVLDFIITANTLGTVDFTNSANFNKVRIRNFQTSGPAFIGTPAALDDIDLFSSGGATSPVFVKSPGKILTGNAAPAASACGTGPTITGSDHAGIIATGTGATACTVTFNAAYVSAPFCTITPQAKASNLDFTRSNTAITMSSVSASAFYHYNCVGQNGG